MSERSDIIDNNDDLALRGIAHRMSLGIEVKTRKYGLLNFQNVFLGTDAVKWLIADPKSGVDDVDKAIEVGQRLIDRGYVIRVSRELKAQELRHFGRAQKAKKEFRSGNSIYRFDTLRISPFLLHVVVRCARGLHPHDMNGKNDPYVKLQLGRQRAVTRVQLRTNNPHWNEHFVFGVTSVESEQLHLTVRDYDKFKIDELIGSCHIGLSHLPCEDACDGDETNLRSSLHRGNGWMASDAAGGAFDGLGHTPCGRHDYRRSAFTNGHSDNDERTPGTDPDNTCQSGMSDGSTGSEPTLGTRTARSFTVGDSDHSDIDPDEWDAVSDTGGSSTSASRSVFSKGSARRSHRRRRRRAQHVRKVADTVKKLVPWPTKTKASPSHDSSAEALFRESDSDDDVGQGQEEVYKAKNTYKIGRAGEGDIGRSVVVDRNGLDDSTLRSSDRSEGAITFYPLVADGCRSPNFLTGKSSHGAESSKEGMQEEGARSTHEGRHNRGELGCDIWLTSFTPRPLPVQGEAKFSLRCRMCYTCGVTSSEERTIGEINGTSIRQRVVLMLNGDQVHSSPFERGKDKKTMFNESMASLDTKANMATDMLKFVVQQRIIPVELVFKPVATVSIPLRNIAVLFPSSNDEVDDDTKSGKNSDVAAAKSGSTADESGSSTLDSVTAASPAAGDGEDGTERSTGSSGPCRRLGEPRPRPYRLHTLAGPFSSHTMDNGSVTMSLMLVPSGNDLLGEQEPEDSEPVHGPLPELPERLRVICVDSSVACGYQRLRKALLWPDSKLMSAYGELMEYTEATAGPWVDADGNAGHQEDMSGCSRERSFVVPKSSMSAATKAQASETILLDGPSAMSYELRVRTPAVPFGDKFEVVTQYGLLKEGPEKCHLTISCDTVFSESIMNLIQGQIVSAVSKVSTESYQQLLELIEDAISGKGAGPNGGGLSGRRKTKGSKRSLWWWPSAFVLFSVISFVLAWGAHWVINRGYGRQHALPVPPGR